MNQNNADFQKKISFRYSNIIQNYIKINLKKLNDFDNYQGTYIINKDISNDMVPLRIYENTTRINIELTEALGTQINVYINQETKILKIVIALNN